MHTTTMSIDANLDLTAPHPPTPQVLGLTTLPCPSQTASVSKSIGIASKALIAPAAARTVTLDITPAARIRWDEITELKGNSIKHVLPESVEELVQMVADNQPLHEESKHPFFIKLAAGPFSDEGACR